MEITNSLDVPLPPDQAWPLLLDIPRIMPCVPGAELIEAVDDRTYKGKVSVRLGPVALSFVGTARIEALDAAARHAQVSARGSDAKGRGGADAVVRFQLEPEGAGTRVRVLTTVNLTGSVAQYGRGTGIIQGVASQLTARFAQNLKAMLERGEDAPGPAQASPQPLEAASRASPPSVQPPQAASGGNGDAGRIEAAALRIEAAAARIEAALRTLQKPPPAEPISGGRLMASVAWNMVKGAFSKKAKAG